MAAVERGDSGLQQLQQGSTFLEMPALVNAGSWNCDSLCRNTEAGEAWIQGDFQLLIAYIRLNFSLASKTLKGSICVNNLVYTILVILL